MDTFHPGSLWFVPVVMSVGFMLWALWGFWRDEKR
jgi:hypothetical protein